MRGWQKLTRDLTDAVIYQIIDLRVSKAQLTKDYFTMRAHQRRRHGLDRGDIFKTHWSANELEFAGSGMLDLFDQTQMFHLRIVEHFSDIVERHRRHIVRLENLEPLIARLGFERRRECL